MADYYVALLGLDGTPPLRVLDLGAGLGYFAAACQALGHDATALDLPESLPEETARALGVRYIPHMIIAGLPLPGDERYDLITAIRLNLTEPDRWQWPEYEAFADDVFGRLNPGGRWLMAPNRGDNVEFVLDIGKWGQILGDRGTASNPNRSTVVLTKAG